MICSLTFSEKQQAWAHHEAGARQSCTALRMGSRLETTKTPERWTRGWTSGGVSLKGLPDQDLGPGRGHQPAGEHAMLQMTPAWHHSARAEQRTPEVAPEKTPETQETQLDTKMNKYGGKMEEKEKRGCRCYE